MYQVTVSLVHLATAMMLTVVWTLIICFIFWTFWLLL